MSVIAEVFSHVLSWFYDTVYCFVMHGGYLGMAVLLFPILRKVCYIFKQLTN